MSCQSKKKIRQIQALEYWRCRRLRSQSMNPPITIDLPGDSYFQSLLCSRLAKQAYPEAGLVWILVIAETAQHHYVCQLVDRAIVIQLRCQSESIKLIFFVLGKESYMASYSGKNRGTLPVEFQNRHTAIFVLIDAFEGGEGK